MKREVLFQNLGEISFKRSGLTQEEVVHQLSAHGKNEIAEVASHPLKEIILETIKDPMIWFLIIIGIVFIFAGEKSDAIVLFVAILPLVLMDVFLHWRTQSSLAALKGNLATTAKVIRDNKEIEINANEIMPGDLVVLKSNDYVPCDGIFIEISALQIDESALTGEAFPIVKEDASVDVQKYIEKKAVWIDEKFLAFAGTRVLTGHGIFLVTQTGQQTQYAQIVKSVTMISHEQTPLQVAISKLVGWLLIAAIFLCFVLAGIRLYQGHGLVDAFLSAATLAIAAIPEEFPVVFTFFLGVGVYRLANKHTLVRRAVSVENIGRINRICTDKTGTITVGQLTLTHVIANSKEENRVIESAVFASNSKDFDPIDLAIHDYPLDQKMADKKILKIFPFTEDRKREVVLASDQTKIFAYTKGAPESILAMSLLSEKELFFWRNETSRYAKEGHKVLASAWREVSLDEADREPVGDFHFAGLMAFEDPPRPEVKEAMKYCQNHNIMVTMLTGDHPDTATAIGKDIQISRGELKVVSAEDDPEKFEKEYLLKNPDFLRDVNIIARCKPIQKLRIVEAFKNSGEIVAVTGDGVNDVPALKMADVSIAMGIRGSRSAKEVSHMILTDDNFSTIVSAISEGRILFKNLKKSFEYLILFHVPFVLVAAAIPLMGYPLLFLPVQIVWLELIIHPTALFAFQELSNNETKKVSSSFFERKEVIVMLGSGIVFALMLMVFFIYFMKETNNIAYARSGIMALLSLWSACLVIMLVGIRSLFVKSLIVATVGMAAFLIGNSFSASLLSLAPLALKHWIYTLLAVIIFVLMLARLRKIINSRK